MFDIDNSFTKWLLKWVVSAIIKVKDERTKIIMRDILVKKLISPRNGVFGPSKSKCPVRYKSNEITWQINTTDTDSTSRSGNGKRYI